MSERRLSIYVVERDYGDYIHSFLVLVDEMQSSDVPAIIEQIHFNDDVYDRMRPEWVEGFKPYHLDNLDKFSFQPYIGGHEQDILPMWNYILAWAGHVKAYPPSFESTYDSPYAVNCQAGVRNALETIGVTFYEEFAQSSIGARATLPSPGERFSYEDQETDVQKMRQNRNTLVAALK